MLDSLPYSTCWLASVQTTLIFTKGNHAPSLRACPCANERTIIGFARRRDRCHGAGWRYGAPHTPAGLAAGNQSAHDRTHASLLVVGSGVVVVVVPIRARALIPVIVSAIVGVAALWALLLVNPTAVSAAVVVVVASQAVRAARESHGLSPRNGQNDRVLQFRVISKPYSPAACQLEQATADSPATVPARGRPARHSWMKGKKGVGTL